MRSQQQHRAGRAREVWGSETDWEGKSAAEELGEPLEEEEGSTPPHAEDRELYSDLMYSKKSIQLQSLSTMGKTKENSRSEFAARIQEPEEGAQEVVLFR